MADTTSPTDTAPTALLVHGAFADSSGWSGVTERLLGRKNTRGRAPDSALNTPTALTFPEEPVNPRPRLM